MEKLLRSGKAVRRGVDLGLSTKQAEVEKTKLVGKKKKKKKN